MFQSKFKIVCVHVGTSWCACGGQGTACRMWLATSNMCVRGMSPDHQAWPQVLLHSSLTTKSKILRGSFNKTSLLQREIKSSFLCSECIGWDKSKQAICTVHKLFPKDNGCIFHLEWYFDSIKWVLRIKVVFKGRPKIRFSEMKKTILT